MSDDEDDTGIEEALAVAAIASAAASVGTGVYAATRGSPDLPEVKPPAPPPPAPPAPQPAPPPPTETEAQEGVTAQRRKRQQRFGVEQTLLTSPLGGGSDLRVGQTTGRSLLGG